MSCSCHTKHRLVIEGAVKPDDQCTTCAAKHIEMARAAWCEFVYEEANRRWVAGHVRLAVEHLKYDHRETALKLRDLAVIIEDNKDADRWDVMLRLESALLEVMALQAADRPELAARMAHLNAPRDKVDVIIPLGGGSPHDNEELRLLLRSIERNALGVGNVYIATTEPPEWLSDEVTVVPITDAHTDCKDANLIDKVLGVIEKHNVKRFVFCADDNCFVKPTRLDSIPLLYNPHIREHFRTGGTWHNRVLHTFAWADGRGIRLEHHFDTHAPQYFRDAATLAERMRQVDYKSGAGLTIMTAFRVVMGEVEHALPQGDWKETYEHQCEDNARFTDFEKPLIGYNDRGFETCLRARLFAMFAEKSRFEK